MPNIFAALAIAIGSWLGVPGGSWTPATTDIAPVKAQLQNYVRQEAKSKGATLPAWGRYTFQYYGQSLHGRRIIFVNAFCSKPPPNAHRQLVVVLDGGACYFQAYWDSATQSFAGVQFNGHA